MMRNKLTRHGAQLCDRRQRCQITGLRIPRRRQILRHRLQHPERAFHDDLVRVRSRPRIRNYANHRLVWANACKAQRRGNIYVVRKRLARLARRPFEYNFCIRQVIDVNTVLNQIRRARQTLWRLPRRNGRRGA